MNINSITNLGNVAEIEPLPEYHKYFYAMILMTIYYESCDYCLRQHGSRWYSAFRGGDETYSLPDPPEHGVAGLLRLLQSVLPHDMNARDLGDLETGGVSHVHIFGLGEELAIAFFVHGRDSDGEWINVRLIYGAACPARAREILNDLAKFWEE
jgi:hypothetical protein